MNRAKRNSILAFFAIAIGAATLSHATDLDGRHAWTTTGSSASASMDDLKKLRLSTSAQYLEEAEAGIAILRYNISATDALVGAMPDSGAWRLRVSFRDNGFKERVQVFLKKIPLGSEGGPILMRIDTNDYPVGKRFEVRTLEKEMAGINFDFEKNAYCLVVILSKYDSELHGPAFVSASLTPVSVSAE